MTQRVLGLTGSRRRRRALFVPFSLVAVVALMLTVGAQAVHDNLEFELDKNATNNLNVTPVGYLASNTSASATSIDVCQTTTGGTLDPHPVNGDIILIRNERMTVDNVDAGGSFGGNCPGTKRVYNVTRPDAQAQSGGANNIGARISLIREVVKPGPDWNQVFSEVSGDPDSTCSSLGLVECAFIEDGIGPSTFTGGSTKDHLPVSGWMHTTGASPDKGEILNAYAAKAVEGDGDQILYFGMDRYAVDGSTDIGFWFFQAPVFACPDPDAGTACDGVPNGQFAGDHVEGDILILGTFTQGGAASNIRVFEWVDSGGNEQEHILGPTGAFGDCVPGSSGDEGCATVNNTTIEVPWTYTFKGESTGGWIPAGGFFEGGINLTARGLEGCFSTFLAETRSSPEITAILKDFALDEFEACDSDLTTTPADSSGTALTDSNDNDLPDIQIGTGSAGVDVKDNASLNVSGISTWSGSVEFFICGPIETGTCDEDGFSAGTTNVDQDSTSVTSNSVNLTSVGRYCWRGEFSSATEGVPDAADASEGECFEVLPVTPTLATTAWSTGDDTGAAQTDPVPFGDPLFDRADLSGTANQPGTNGTNTTYPTIEATDGAVANGSITFTLVKDDCSTPATGTGTNPETGVAVSGDGDYYSSGFTPDAPGDYHWQASYSGDSPNTLDKSHNDLCDDPAEAVTVEQVPTAISTSQFFYPNDSATVSTDDSSDLPSGGEVVFSAYAGTVDATVLENCQAGGTTGRLFTETQAISGASPQTVSTTNTTEEVPPGTIIYWNVQYFPNDTAYEGRESICVETTTLSITDDSGPGTVPSP